MPMTYNPTDPEQEEFEEGQSDLELQLNLYSGTDSPSEDHDGHGEYGEHSEYGEYDDDLLYDPELSLPAFGAAQKKGAHVSKQARLRSVAELADTAMVGDLIITLNSGERYDVAVLNANLDDHQKFSSLLTAPLYTPQGKELRTGEYYTLLTSGTEDLRFFLSTKSAVRHLREAMNLGRTFTLMRFWDDKIGGSIVGFPVIISGYSVSSVATVGNWDH